MVDELIHHGWKVDNDGLNSSIMMIIMILTMVMFVAMFTCHVWQFYYIPHCVIICCSLCYVLLFIMFYCISFNATYCCFSCYVGVFSTFYFTIHHVMFYCLSYYFILLLVMLWCVVHCFPLYYTSVTTTYVLNEALFPSINIFVFAFASSLCAHLASPTLKKICIFSCSSIFFFVLVQMLVALTFFALQGCLCKSEPSNLNFSFWFKLDTF